MNRHTDAKLVYDSARAPRVPGVRAAFCADRFLQFQAGTLAIDVVAHAAVGEHTRMLHGQVLDIAASRPLASVAVRPAGYGSATTTDRLGQFAVIVPAGDDEPRTLEIETASGPIHVTLPAMDPCPWTGDDF